MAKAQKTSKLKVKKKRWFPILAPKSMGQKEVGESYLNEGTEAIGRVMRINLRDLTGSIGDQNIYVSLRITGMEGSNLQTEIVGYAFMPFYIKKLARRNSGRIDDSFVLKTKDGKKIRLKPLVLTVFGVAKSVKTTIRNEMLRLLNEEASKSNFDQIVNDLLRRKLQAEFKKKLNKICPIKEVALRAVKLEEGKKGKVAKVVTKVEKEEQSEEKA